MKKTLALVILFSVLAGFLLVQPLGSIYAQGEVPPPTPYPGESDYVTFEALDIADEVMVGPYANSYIRFSTPDSWSLQPEGAKIILEIETTARSSRTFSGDADGYSGALLEVVLNGHVIDTIFLRTGAETIELVVPEGALYSTRPDGQHSLQIFLNATIDCLFDHETSVLVKNSSGFSLPHNNVSPSPNITLLPRPFYKKASLLPEEVILLLPDAPTVSELEAAMVVSASIGRMTGGEQVVSVASLGTITPAQKENAHIIMVGMDDSLPVLNEVSFLVNQTAGVSDGIVHMAVSPWNASRVVLYVGGGDENGVLKAAQAFSSGALRVGKHYSVSVISDVAESVEITEVADDRTFASLGYLSQTISGVGYGALEYEFMVPLGKAPAGDSYIELLYTHSAIFDFDSSGANITLNGEPLGSMRFSEETANQVNKLTINVPDYTIHPGRNVLSVQAEFIPLDYCSTLNDAGLWMSVNDNSLVHVPLVDANQSAITYTHDLGLFPTPFINDPSLSDLSIVLPAKDVNSWDIAAKLAANLGSYANGKTLQLSVFYPDDIPAEAQADNHFIVIGRASQLPVLSEMADIMPARFEAGSDMAIEDNSMITFSLPEGTDLGYLEFFASPWDSTHSVLTIMGSTPLGLEWAEDALFNPIYQPDLRGDYVVVHAEKAYSIDTRLGLGVQNLSATAVPGAIPTLIPDNVPMTSYAYQQDWVIIAIGITTGGILLMLIGLAVRALFKNRANK